jgi:transcriptional regulator with XRE-family HTH domain
MQTYDNSPTARAERLRRVRLMAGLKRGEFANLAGVSPTTVSYWENVTHSGLTEDGANKTVDAVAKAGVFCTTTWLLNGEGEPPQLINTLTTNALPGSHFTQLAPDLSLEIEMFRKYQGAVVVQISDDAMLPVLLPKDFIGGIWQSIDTIQLSDEDTYIVQINGELQIRKVKAALYTGKFDVHSICYSPDAMYSHTIKNIVLEKIARISRVWR